MLWYDIFNLINDCVFIKEIDDKNDCVFMY